MDRCKIFTRYLNRLAIYPQYGCPFFSLTENFFLPSNQDSEFDDMENPIYRRPKSLDHLVAVTHFSRTELKKLYRDFKAECPTGLIKEETFRTMYTQFFPKGGSYFHFFFYKTFNR